MQAAIAALHAEAPTPAATDWRQILGLYAVLMRLAPSPVIELNHAAALAMVDGPAAALRRVEALAARGTLDGYDVLPAVRADLLRRLGRKDEARRPPTRTPCAWRATTPNAASSAAAWPSWRAARRQAIGARRNPSPSPDAAASRAPPSPSGRGIG